MAYLRRLREILDNKPTKKKLKVEMAVTIDRMVKARVSDRRSATMNGRTLSPGISRG